MYLKLLVQYIRVKRHNKHTHASCVWDRAKNKAWLDRDLKHGQGNVGVRCRAGLEPGFIQGLGGVKTGDEDEYRVRLRVGLRVKCSNILIYI